MAISLASQLTNLAELLNAGFTRAADMLWKAKSTGELLSIA